MNLRDYIRMDLCVERFLPTGFEKRTVSTSDSQLI